MSHLVQKGWRRLVGRPCHHKVATLCPDTTPVSARAGEGAPHPALPVQLAGRGACLINKL